MPEEKISLRRGGKLLRPDTAEAFEDLTRALFSALYKDPHANLLGRNGQDQGGIDVVCQDPQGGRVGVQCKLSIGDPNRQPTVEAFQNDVKAARSAHPDLKRFIFLATAPNHAPLQAEAQRLSQENAALGLFIVEYHGWDWIEETIRLFPHLIFEFGLAGQVETPAPAPTIMAAIGGRLSLAIDLINRGRGSSDAINLQRLAGVLGRSDWRDFEAISTGASAAGFDELRGLAIGIGLRPEWLIEGREEPFSREETLFDANDQYDGILAIRPRKLVFARSNEPPYSALIAAQVDEVRWRVFDFHPTGPEVGGSGRRQLFEFCSLIRRLVGHYGLAVQFGGQQVSDADFQDLLGGQRHPGQILNATWNDPWWQDFAELCPERVMDDNPAAEALVGAIAITAKVLAEFQAKAGEAWHAAQLKRAHWPVRADGDRILVYPETVARRAPTRPATEGVSDWPRVKALEARDAKFWLEGASDGALLKGHCEIAIVNTAKIALQDCSVVLVGLSDSSGTLSLDQPRRLGRLAKNFTLGGGDRTRLALARRDLADIINRPPWILVAEGAPIGLADGETYDLLLELRSNYDFPTTVRLRLTVNPGRNVAAEILEQSV